MKLRVLFIGLCMALASNIVYAQRPSLPASCEAFFPSELAPKGKTQTIKESDVNKFLASGTFGQKGTNTRKFWKVVSDRSSNPVYSTSTSSSKIDALDWNQSVTILKIQNNRALVAEGSFRDVDYPKMPVNAKCIGWVPMSNLLLWESCPTDDAGIYQKSLIVHKIDAAQETVQLDSRKVYRNPDALSTDNFALPTTNQFFYIMKRDESKKLVLLSAQYSLYKGVSDKVLFGWVKENSYIPWSQRTCIEPTWDESDLQYFKQNGINANIYKTKNQTQSISHHSFAEREGRIPGRELRYPLLDDNVKDDNGEILTYNISAFKNLSGNLGAHMGLPMDMLTKMSTVNICLVVDGTESMRPYYPAIKEAIKEGCKQFVNRKVNVAIIIYRDKPHVKDGQSYEIEKLNFSNPDSQNLASFLDTGGRYGFESSRDKTAEESLYKGIDTGLELFAGKEDQSNVMIVVGDCGDNGAYPDLTISTLSQKIIDRKVNLLAFQVMNKTAPAAYGKFQNLSMLMKNAYVSYFNKIKTETNINPRIERIPNESGFEGKNDPQFNVYLGACRYPLLGQVMSAESLKQNMIKSIDQIKDAVQKQIDIVVALETGLGVQVLDEAWLESLGIDITNTGYVAYSGYSPRYHKQSKREFYKPVLFISHEEWITLQNKLNPVAQLASRPTLDRKPFIDALMALIRSFVPDITPEEMNQMTMSEVMALAAGLNVTTETLGKYTISQIADKDIVDQARYVSILKSFAAKFERLKNKVSANYPYHRTFNGNTHYWIPIEELP